jgi:hypothetical protein
MISLFTAHLACFAIEFMAGRPVYKKQDLMIVQNFFITKVKIYTHSRSVVSSDKNENKKKEIWLKSAFYEFPLH